MKKLVYIAITVFFACNFASSQDNDDWRLTKDPSTRLRVIGNYTYLPQADNIPNQNSTVRKVHTNSGDILVFPNIRPFPHPVTTESEVAVCTEYGNQNVMYAAWNSYGPAFYGTGYFFTNNGGQNWTGNTQMIVSGNNGDPGPWIWSAASSYPGRLGLSVIGSSGVYSTNSTDNGTTWTPFVNMGGTSVDKNFSCSDEVTGSPFLGRAYTVWTDFGGTYANRIVGAYTSNGGVSWTGYQPVSPVPPTGHHMQGCDIAVGPGGVVYCVWATCLTSGSNSTEDFLGFAKSTDGGVTWPVSSYNVVDINGIRALSMLTTNVRVNGFPRIAVDHSGGSRNGWIYVTLSEKLVLPARDNSDITLCRSTDGGTTWTHSLVNGDPPGNYNFLSSVCVDQTNGMVGIGYYDERNTVNPVTQYYVSFSVNGGLTWTDVQASDHNFTPQPLPGLGTGGYFGDYTGITYSNGKLFPFWMDNSSGISNIWTCPLVAVQFSHDISCGPFLGLPQNPLLYNLPYNIKTRIINDGTSSETGIPVKFFVNGTLMNITNKDITSGQADSVDNVWTPTAAGTYQIMYVSALTTDQDRTNDTVRTTIIALTSLPPLCEHFRGATFPPLGWTVSGSGANYWFGGPGGSGTAAYKMYIAPLGANGYLSSLTFSVISNPVLHFNIAYAPYPANPPYVPDSLIVLSSTDAGVTWTTVVSYGPVQMQTAPGMTGEFTPVSTQWASKQFSLPPGTNKIQFLGKSAFGNDLYIDSVCVLAPNGISVNENLIPLTFSLSQNYPNPFNPTTIINFGIPKAGIVKLVVYDILGRTVATLVDEFRQAGSYKSNFDGTNLASGIYFYRFESGDYVNMKKMVLIK